MILPDLKPVAYEGEVFRNIYTCHPSQALLDDVCDDPADAALVDAFVQMTSGVDHLEPQNQRPFQYGRIEEGEILAVFEKENWRPTRFSSGQYFGVWYGSEEALTSVHETCWGAYQLAKDNVLSRGEVYTTDRTMFKARVQAMRAVDLMKALDFYRQLVSDNYQFCQALGQELRQKEFELIRTPSARHRGGVCTPVFSQDSVRATSILYYLRYNIHPDGVISVNSTQPEMNFSIPAVALAA